MERGRDEIAELRDRYSGMTDVELLTALAELPVLPDEADEAWMTDALWTTVANPFLAFSRLAAARRLVSAIPLLLARACFGDPFEIMRCLRHDLEAMVAPDWQVLVAACVGAAGSSRPGTRLWALDEIRVLRDESARPVVEQSLQHELPEIRRAAASALEALDGSGQQAPGADGPRGNQ